MRFRFADFTLDQETRQLARGSEGLHLEPKAYELLALLLERRPAVVSKSEIQAQLWPDTFVSEGNVTGLVTQIRQALQDARAQSRFIRTVHGFGYAFCGDAVPDRAERPRPAACVVWGHQVLPLQIGENVLGRAEDSLVRIDAPGVSRQHARITLSHESALLEDLDSKNGTHLRDRRLDAPAALQDGDAIRLGSQALVFRRSPGDGTTATEPER
jgi:DNA-binding winged helix-turn-helix (wHTH) protein